MLQDSGTDQPCTGCGSFGLEGGVTSGSRHSRSGAKERVQRTSSCPPGKVHSVSAGPWSLEWARRHKDVEVGEVSKQGFRGKKKATSSTHGVSRKKGRGYLRHCTKNLKRIARLSEEDRKQVLRALRKTHRRRKVVSSASNDKEITNESSSANGSQNSVTNDWMNWLVLHGRGEVLNEDVRELGKVVGLNFHNSFDVLSGAGRKNKEGDGNG